MSLRALAAHVGVLTEYTSYRGERIEVHDEVLAAVLAACGVDTTLSVERAIADYDDRTRAQRSIVVAWNELEQQNVPGTTTERPNWRRLTRFRVDELDDDPAVGATLEATRR